MKPFDRLRIELCSDKITESGCWVWNKAVNACGYGILKRGLAHRVSYTVFKGVIPNGMCVLHSCDVPSCVNPNHLFIGTHTDNMRDRSNKGRGNLEKLSKSQVDEIRGLYANGLTQYEIADKFDITQSNVSCIVNMKTWK